jgi:hypothetical protein
MAKLLIYAPRPNALHQRQRLANTRNIFVGQI